ncbi:hypothetical protein J7F03_03815 [Streptomyces sp. ISL-43]|uniref:hypothetical protein n=1 Tax=Streptomyces sp. ISL-43 TaxID=2819183 RepID=UPI001BE8039A|nr:hypothetical protein [Streptomyces sp. ISL-43]MBT2446225.1 hypothetical protein [Streptomyces sp. ISL-43]
MNRTWTRRLVLLTASTALAAGGASLSTTASATPTTHPATAITADGEYEGKSLLEGGGGGDAGYPIPTMGYMYQKWGSHTVHSTL